MENLLPDLNSLEYSLNVNAENGDLGALISFLGLGLPIEGTLTTNVSFKGMGKEPLIDGYAVVEAASVYGRFVDKGAFKYRYADREFNLRKGRFTEGDSSLKLTGSVSLDQEFSFIASTDNLSLRNIFEGAYDIDYSAWLRISGDGTFDDPNIKAEGDLRHGMFRGYPLLEAYMKGSLAGEKYDLKDNILSFHELKGDVYGGKAKVG